MDNPPVAPGRLVGHMANPLVATLLGLRGNPRACVYTEPLWGLSINLVLPYASVYMVALGLRDMQIGLISTVGMLFQVVAGLMGGVITDKYGRRRTTAIYDFIAWSLPCWVWFGASFFAPRPAFWLFLGASVVNSTWQITQNSWDCLLVEDADRQQIPRVYSLVMVAGHLSALFAPISAALVAHFSLIVAMRILYVNAFVVMTTKIIVLYRWSRETGTGRTRMAETKGVPLWRLVLEYRGVLPIIRRSPGTIFALFIAAVVGAIGTVNQTFWQIIISQKLLVPDALLPFFPMARSLLAILFFFTVIHRISGTTHFRAPLLWGFGAYLVGQVLVSLLRAPDGGQATWHTYVALGVCVLFDSFGVGMLAMLAEAIVALVVDRAERSRVMAVQRTVVMLCVAPFGWIGGALSGINRSLPFVLTAALIVLGSVVTLAHYRREAGRQ